MIAEMRRGEFGEHHLLKGAAPGVRLERQHLT